MRAWMQALAWTAPITRTLPWRKHQLHSPTVVPARQNFADYWDLQCLTALHKWGGRFSRLHISFDCWLHISVFASDCACLASDSMRQLPPLLFSAAWLAFSGKGVWFLLHICTSVYTPNDNISLQPNFGPLSGTVPNFVPTLFKILVPVLWFDYSHLVTRNWAICFIWNLDLHKHASFPSCLKLPSLNPA